MDEKAFRFAEAISKAVREVAGKSAIDDPAEAEALLVALSSVLGNFLFQLSVSVREHPLKVLSAVIQGTVAAFLSHKAAYDELKRAIN